MLDYKQQFAGIQKNVIDSLEALFPFNGKNRTITAQKIWTEDNLRDDDFEGQKKAKNNNRTWAIPVYGALTLTDNSTGKVIDRKNKVKLASLPKITPRGSFIVDGTEYQVSNQLRLKPGVYTRIKENGELESQVNLAKGKNFKVWLNPKTGTFYINVGTSNVRLYHILIALGFTHSQIANSWGKDLAEKNKAGNYDTEVSKLYKAYFGRAPGTSADAMAGIEDQFNRTELDKDTTKITLGKAFTAVDKNLLMKTSERILDISRGQSKPDDRDSLEFKSVHSAEDFIAERIEKSARNIIWKINQAIEKRDSIREIIPIETINQPVKGFFSATQLANHSEQTNPISMVSDLTKITLMGDGGIGNMQAVTNKARAVHPSSLGFLDPIHTPESEKIGVNLYLALGAKKKGNTLVSKMRNVKTGKTEELTPGEAMDKYVAFPDQYDLSGTVPKARSSKIKVTHKGKAKVVSASKVEYVIPSSSAAFDLSSNLIPFLQNNQGNRAFMATKMLGQAQPLKHREQPLVQVGTGYGNTFDEFMAKATDAAAPVDGEVTKVTKDEIYIKDSSGKTHKAGIYNHYPLNSKMYFHHKPTVSKGSKVKKGETVAELNYNKDGKLAIGTNLTTAYMPYNGYNFEDGIVISESASKKLTSEHLHKMTMNIDMETILSLKKFRAYYPKAVTEAQAAKLDEKGVIRQGSKVRKGDILAVSLKKKIKSPEDESLQRLHRAMYKPYKAEVLEWKYPDEGEVLDIITTGNYIEIQVATEEPARVGDKLSGRYGNKGIITYVIPDEETPVTKSGEKVDIILNPDGVPTRINIGQLLETAGGKVAKKKGKPMIVNNFSGVDYKKKIEEELKSMGMTDKETIVDPSTGKEIPNINVGTQYTLKLDHPTRKKFSVREVGGGYSSEFQPSTGSKGGAASIGQMEFYSLLSNGAKANLKEMHTYKSDKNDEFWRAIQTGQPIPTPKIPFASEKFEAYMNGLGVNVEKRGNGLQLVPMRDKDVLKNSSGEIKGSYLLRGKDLRPEKDGLFDPNITGGMSGDKWSHVRLAEALPNPMFEKAIMSVGDITKKQFNSIIEGKQQVDKSGELVESGGDIGSKGMKNLLSNINVEKEFKKTEEVAKNTKGSNLNKANKKLRYLKALKEFEMKPEDYMSTTLPVVPPKFRPIYPLGDGNLVVSDLNQAYKDIVVVNKQLKEQQKSNKSLGLSDAQNNTLRKDLYESMSALAGLTDSTTRKEFKGITKLIAGNNPKGGFFQGTLMKKPQELSGRSTIVVEPKLGIDEIGIPDDMAWKTYKPFVQRRLVAQGFSPLQAREQVENRTEMASKALDAEMEQRPAFANRAPSLHKFSILSFEPKRVAGKAIKLNPLVVGGFTADFDGDTMAVHVPATEDARREAFKMMPSKQIFSPRDNSLVHKPSGESVLGLYLLTKDGKDTNKKYGTMQDAVAAYKRGEIQVSDKISLNGTKITVGKMIVNSVLPPKYRSNGIYLNSGKIKSMLADIRKDDPNEFKRVINRLKDIGLETATNIGFSVGLSDLKGPYQERDKILAKAEAKVQKAAPGKKEEVTLKAYEEATKELEGFLNKHMPGKENAFWQMYESGARGGLSQVRQILSAPVLVKDTDNKVVPIPIKKSYSEGLEMGDYWTTMAGARKGIIDRALSTAIPGYFSKQVVNSALSYSVDSEDCGTKDGVMMTVDDWDIVDRYLAKDQFGMKRNTLITSKNLPMMKTKSKRWMVRSPMTCVRPKGVCSHCFGLREDGNKPQLGENIGVLAAQSISEPATQMVLKSFHGGGMASDTAGMTTGFQRVQELLNMPEILPNSGTMSSVTGKVKSVNKNPAGGWDINVNDEDHYVQGGRKVLVKPGQSILRGDRLSDGSLRPQDILEFKGLKPTQDYLKTELKNTYASQGINVKDRIFETIVKPLTNNAQITDAGGSKKWVVGDWAPLNEVEDFNKKTERPVKYKPVISGVNTQPLKGNDWISRLNYENLQKTLVEGSSQGWKEDIKGNSPIAEYIFGPAFSKAQSKYAGIYNGMRPSEERVDEDRSKVQLMRDEQFETEDKPKPAGIARGNKTTNVPNQSLQERLNLKTQGDRFTPGKEGVDPNHEKTAALDWKYYAYNEGYPVSTYLKKIESTTDINLLNALANPNSGILGQDGKPISGAQKAMIMQAANRRLNSNL